MCTSIFYMNPVRNENLRKFQTYLIYLFSEYIEIFINGLRMRYDVDFMPASTSTIKYFVTIL